MVDIGVHLRSAYYAVLNGNITIEGNQIPVVDEKLDVDVSEQDAYVMFITQTEETETVANKTNYVNETLMRIQVVNQRRATNTKEIVEEVSSQILSLLFPAKNTTAITLGSPLNLTYAKYVTGDYRPLTKNDKGFLISKVLTFKNRVTQ